MTDLQKRMIESLQLRGMSERTQEAYARAVRQLAHHYHKSPGLITEEESQTVFPVHQECQELVARHDHHRVVRDQVLHRVDPGQEMDPVRVGSSGPREKAANDTRRGRGSEDPRVCKTARIPGVSDDDLLVRAAACRKGLIFEWPISTASEG